MLLFIITMILTSIMIMGCVGDSKVSIREKKIYLLYVLIFFFICTAFSVVTYVVSYV